MIQAQMDFLLEDLLHHSLLTLSFLYLMLYRLALPLTCSYSQFNNLCP